MPTIGDALELVLIAVLERKTAASRKVLHSRRDQHLARTSQCSDSRTDDNPEAAHLPLDRLALPGMKTGADLEIERTDSFDDPLRSSNRPSRAVQAREEPVTGGIAIPGLRETQPRRLLR